jgi:hypothetical protein
MYYFIQAANRPVPIAFQLFTFGLIFIYIWAAHTIYYIRHCKLGTKFGVAFSIVNSSVLGGGMINGL